MRDSSHQDEMRRIAGILDHGAEPVDDDPTVDEMGVFSLIDHNDTEELNRARRLGFTSYLVGTDAGVRAAKLFNSQLSRLRWQLHFLFGIVLAVSGLAAGLFAYLLNRGL